MEPVEPTKFFDALSRHLHEDELDGWDHQALLGLLLPPIALDSDLGDYGNGQHRSLAMMDQGLEYVVATWNGDDDRAMPGVYRYEV